MEFYGVASFLAIFVAMSLLWVDMLILWHFFFAYPVLSKEYEEVCKNEYRQLIFDNSKAGDSKSL